MSKKLLLRILAIISISAGAGFYIAQDVLSPAYGAYRQAENLYRCASFPSDLVLEEAPSESESGNECWWLNSGGMFFIKRALAETTNGPIYTLPKWQKLYAKNDPENTDGGWHPENIFRLVNLTRFEDGREEVYFNIQSYHKSDSPNRNMTNGVFLFFRYADTQNLYLAGLRVDGTAVIKRKLDGIYETIGTVSWSDPRLYHGKSNPSLLPTREWIGMAAEVENKNDAVVIKFQVDYGDNRGWQTLLTAKDYPGNIPDGDILMKPGKGGMRSDFMEVQFRDFKIGAIASK